MKRVAALLLVLAVPAGAQDQEDEPHRLDRLRTQELNARSPNGYAPSPYAAQADAGAADYQAALGDYRRRLADWRRRVAACNAGYTDACQR